MPTTRPAAGAPRPLPVLVLNRGSASTRALGAIKADPRVELIHADGKTSEWTAFAQRASAVLVMTDSDPLSALLYALTARVTAPIVIAAPARFKTRAKELADAGAAASLFTPITKAGVNRILRALANAPDGARVDGTLRFVLDPIGRVVRFRSKAVRLSPREFAVLHCLSNRSGLPVSAAELLSYAWADKSSRHQTRQILEVYIFSLRRKLRRLGLSDAIATVRGYGYTLTAT